MKKVRLDQLVFDQGLSESRERDHYERCCLC